MTGTWVGTWFSRRGRPAVMGVLILVGLTLIGQLLIPGFASPRNLLTVLALAVLLAVPACGQTFVIISGGGGIDLSIGAVMSLAEVLGAQVMNGQNGLLLPALLLVAATGGFIGLLNGLGIWFLDIPPLVMTLGMAGIADGFALVYTNGEPGGSSSPILSFLGTGSIAGIPVLILVGIAALILSQLVLNRTAYGRMLRLVGSSRSAAAAARIPVGLVVIVTYVISGIVSALAGLVLLGYTMTSYLSAGDAYQLTTIAAVVVGGTPLLGGDGGFGSTALGALVITLINGIVVSLHMGSGAQEIVDGAILLLVLAVYGVAQTGNFTSRWLQAVVGSVSMARIRIDQHADSERGRSVSDGAEGRP